MSDRIVQFFVAGEPVQQGNLRVSRSGHAYSADKGLKDWRLGIGYGARQHFTELVTEAVCVSLFFVMPRPKSLAKSRRVPHTKRPDLDKLARGALDAMTGVVFPDDSCVNQLSCSKRYADIGEQPGVMVTVQWERVPE